MLGIVVDNVSAVIPVPVSSIQTLPNDTGEKEPASGSRARFLKGIIQRDFGVAALLNIERVIDEIRLA